MSDPTLPYQKLNMKDAERYHERYLELRFQNPRMKADEICGKIGVSPNKMLRYKHMLGMEKRRSSKTTSEKQESYKKGLVTRIRNEQQKKFLGELAKGKLSAEDIQNLIDAWDREHAGIGSTPVSGTASEARQQQQQRTNVRGGRPQEPAKQQQVSDPNAIVRGEA